MGPMGCSYSFLPIFGTSGTCYHRAPPRPEENATRGQRVAFEDGTCLQYRFSFGKPFQMDAGFCSGFFVVDFQPCAVYIVGSSYVLLYPSFCCQTVRDDRHIFYRHALRIRPMHVQYCEHCLWIFIRFMNRFFAEEREF